MELSGRSFRQIIRRTKFQQRGKGIAESCAYNKQGKNTVQQKVGDFFFSFMDTKAIESR